ncbi:GntR family transcriptional regulator [Bordetella genomosp. 5]|uniref:GntR family transcriptional regulator n=1 Tax=Bordetella genomosp. 5 TaxID=1395608 RepID=A0A261T060_9BORD|nr:FCD domain-containing protein [Bordetella genomosp. 5]OZI33505.1 GntR family transcriptional regulator [Bordetella genomosp. 5]OZI42815.1 GntR family transcriptional regulator [Bordetella genomosp. 5]
MDKASAMRAAILDHLHTGAWPAGHRLPTERALCDQYGLSRSTVRRTLQQLKEQGLISQRVGSGTYVNASDHLVQTAQALRTEALSTSPAELMAARLVLEPAIAALVVQYATPADFALLEEACDRAEAAESFEAFEVWDARLHERMATATHNQFIENVFALMTAARSQASWGALKRKSLTPERRQAYQEEHRAIVDALKDRDAERAMAQVRRHLVHVRENLLGV